MTDVKTILPLFVGTFLSFSVFAETFEGPRSLALGGATRGAIQLNEGLLMNPAAIALTQKVSVEAQSQLRNGKIRHFFSILDTKTSAIAGGLGYIWDPASIDFKHTALAGLAYGLPPYASMGVTGRVQFREPDFVQEWDGDIGLQAYPFNILMLGLVLHNARFQSPQPDREVAKLGGGIQFIAHPMLYLSSDVVLPLLGDNKVPSWHLGAEVVHATGVVLRFGYHFTQDVAVGAYSAGLGFALAKLGLYYALQDGPQVPLSHSASLRILF